MTVSNEQVDVTGRLLRIENFSLAPEGEGYPELARVGQRELVPRAAHAGR